MVTLIKETSRRTSLIIVVAVTLLYMATLTSDYYWDGITFALQIEKVAAGSRGTYLLFHQNHLAYNAVGYSVYQCAQGVGLGLRCLQVLQIANAFLGAAAVGVFFGITYRATRNYYAAIVCSLTLAVSAAWWKISTDANAYSLTLLLILVCLSNLLGGKPRWLIAGAMLAAAMLTHQLASLFFPAALVAIGSSKVIKQKVRFAVLMSMLAWIVTLAAYYVCAAIQFGIYRPFGVVKWATSNPSQKSLSANPLEGIVSFPRSNFDAIIGHNFTLLRQNGGWLEITIVLVAIMLALSAVFKAAPKARALRDMKALLRCQPEMADARRQIVPVLLAWVGAYVLFLTFWGPLIYFRAFYTPALALGLALILSNFHSACRKGPTGAAALGVAALALLNFGLYIQINMCPESNSLVAAARRAAGGWDKHTLIWFMDRNEADTAFEYFSPDVTWRRLTPEASQNLANTSRSVNGEGGSIWLNKGAAESMDPNWLQKYARGSLIEIKSSNGVARYVQLSE